MREVANRPPPVGGQDVDHFTYPGCKSLDAQPAVEEEGADLGGPQQVFQFLVCFGDLLQLVLQIVVDGLQFLVERLQLFFTGFQLLRGRPVFLVDGLQLLVGRFHFLVRAVIFLDGDLQLLAQVLDLGLKLGDQRFLFGLSGRRVLLRTGHVQGFVDFVLEKQHQSLFFRHSTLPC